MENGGNNNNIAIQCVNKLCVDTYSQLILHMSVIINNDTYINKYFIFLGQEET